MALILIIVGLVYLVLVGYFVVIMRRQADALVRALETEGPDGLWQELGAPATMRDAVRDPKRRWTKFIRSGQYRTRCSPTLVAKIDAFRTFTNRGLLLTALVGGLVLLTFLPLLAMGFR